MGKTGRILAECDYDFFDWFIDSEVASMRESHFVPFERGPSACGSLPRKRKGAALSRRPNPNQQSKNGVLTMAINDSIRSCFNQFAGIAQALEELELRNDEEPSATLHVLNQHFHLALDAMDKHLSEAGFN